MEDVIDAFVVVSLLNNGLDHWLFTLTLFPMFLLIVNLIDNDFLKFVADTTLIKVCTQFFQIGSLGHPLAPLPT